MTKVVTIRAQQRWDYCFESRKTEAALLNTLNTLGQQGWDLVEVLYYKDLKGIMTWTAFLKRPSVSHASSPNMPTTTPSTPAEGPADVPSGFDLSGSEFPVKPPAVEEKSKAAEETPKANNAQV